MRLTIFGSGYVGLVTGACMAETGNHVVCVDIDEDKINRLNAGEMPIYEPGLDDYLKRNRESGRLEALTTDCFSLSRSARHPTKTGPQICSTSSPSRSRSANT
jgi:UDP-glucose 6-dehydrogenase